MKKRLFHSVVLMLAFAVTPHAIAQDSERQTKGDSNKPHLAELTSAALVDQLKCREQPQAARAINAMLKNHQIRYVANESGVYLFEPTASLNLLGLKVVHVSGFDDDGAFKGVPNSLMVGTAPPVFLEIDVAAPVGELRKRALAAGLTESVPSRGIRGFEISAEGYATYLARKSAVTTSSIRSVK
jgi:hypothetical protein